MIFVIIIFFLLLYRVYNIEFLSNEMKNEFYILSNKLHNILKEHNIKYFIIGGTLLGSVREKEIIAWDDDIDIGIFEDDLEKFNKIDFKKYGLKAEGVNKNNIGKIFYINKYDNGFKFKSVFIDIFIFEKKEDKYLYTYEYAKKTWPNEFFYEKELFPLKLYDFGKLKLYGPNLYEDYCKRAWGNNWNKPPFFKSTLYYCNKKFLYLLIILIFYLFIKIFSSNIFHMKVSSS